PMQGGSYGIIAAQRALQKVRVTAEKSQGEQQMNIAFRPARVKTELIGKLENRTATIGIVGLGYVGLPLSLRFAEVGYKVVGMDIDAAKVESLNGGRSYIKHIGSDTV